MTLQQAFEWLTAVVGVAMSLGYYPQAYKIIRNKSAKDVSIITYIIFAVGTFIWTLYGFYVKDVVIISGFAVGVVGSWLVLILSLKYRNKNIHPQ